MEKQTIWYFLHIICNFIVVCLTYNDFKLCLINPINAFNNNEFNGSALGITTGLHIFHIIRDYKLLNMIDWLHHIISNFLMSYIGIYLYHNKVFNCGLFFMCGLPGGIDYTLLFLYKLGYVNKITEKKVNVILNNWIRLPGILYSCYLMHIGFTLNLIKSYFVLYYIAQIVTLFNAVYFAQRVTLNCGYYLKNN